MASLTYPVSVLIRPNQDRKNQTFYDSFLKKSPSTHTPTIRFGTKLGREGTEKTLETDNQCRNLIGPRLTFVSVRWPLCSLRRKRAAASTQNGGKRAGCPP